MYVQINVSRRIKGVIRLDGKECGHLGEAIKMARKCLIIMVKSRLER